MKRLLIILALLAATAVQAQERHRVMFYNVENLFDPFNDSLKRDDEFTPTGPRHWTWSKMQRKINKIYQVIMSVGELDPPDLVGLCEVENYFVLHRLVTKTPLSKYNYRIVHQESPDRRGIDVALLYRPDRFKVEERHFFPVYFPHDPRRTTRDILYTRGILGGDTLHIFVNHWPSKFGGELESEPGRYRVAGILRQKIDSIRVFYPDARIFIMGDMNDEPESLPVVDTLGACLTAEADCPGQLVNMSAILKSKGFGSYKYQGVWGIIDQLILSKSLLNGHHQLLTTPEMARVFSAPFLLEPDDRFTGQKPFRTFVGFKYNGGFSDHLPVYIDLMEAN